MKPLLLSLFLATACAVTSYGQTIKSLGYNTTNGEVVANTGTNVLTFTNAVVTFNGVTSEGFSFDGGANFDLANGELQFDANAIYSVGSGTSFDVFVPIGFVGDEAATNAAITRTNLGLGATWLTNTNVTNFRTAIGLGATNDVEFVSVALESIYRAGGTNLSIDVDDNTLYSATTTNVMLDWGGTGVLIHGPLSFNNTTNAAATRTNLGLGATNDVEFNSVRAGGGFTIDLTVGQVLDGTNDQFSFGGTWYLPISFNNTTNAAITRTNLGLGGGIATNISVLVSGGGTNTLQFSNGILTNVTSP